MPEDLTAPRPPVFDPRAAILDAVERPLGVWTLRNPRLGGKPYGVVKLVRLDGKPCYRVDVIGVHVGYRGTLASACEDACRERLNRDALSRDAY